MHYTSKYNHRAAGFTLLEIIIVVGLIAALAGVLVANLGVIGNQGNIQIEQQFVNSGLTAPLMSYRFAMGNYPTTEQGLNALLEKPSGAGSKWRGPYISSKLVDSWGSPYNYRSPGSHVPNQPDIWSNGPDGVNNNGSGDDIVNWDE